MKLFIAASAASTSSCTHLADLSTFCCTQSLYHETQTASCIVAHNISTSELATFAQFVEIFKDFNDSLISLTLTIFQGYRSNTSCQSKAVSSEFAINGCDHNNLSLSILIFKKASTTLWYWYAINPTHIS